MENTDSDWESVSLPPNQQEVGKNVSASLRDSPAGGSESNSFPPAVAGQRRHNDDEDSVSSWAEIPSRSSPWNTMVEPSARSWSPLSRSSSSSSFVQVHSAHCSVKEARQEDEDYDSVNKDSDTDSLASTHRRFERLHLQTGPTPPSALLISIQQGLSEDIKAATKLEDVQEEDCEDEYEYEDHDEDDDDDQQGFMGRLLLSDCKKPAVLCIKATTTLAEEDSTPEEEEEEDKIAEQFELLTVSGQVHRQCKRCTTLNDPQAVFCATCQVALISNPNPQADHHLAEQFLAGEETFSWIQTKEYELAHRGLVDKPPLEQAKIFIDDVERTLEAFLKLSVKQQVHPPIDVISVLTTPSIEWQLGVVVDFIQQAQHQAGDLGSFSSSYYNASGGSEGLLCSSCGVFSASGTEICPHCYCFLDDVGDHAATEGTTSPPASGENDCLTCAFCTFVNTLGSWKCQVCQNPLPPHLASSNDDYNNSRKRSSVTTIGDVYSKEIKLMIMLTCDGSERDIGPQGTEHWLRQAILREQRLLEEGTNNFFSEDNEVGSDTDGNEDHNLRRLGWIVAKIEGPPSIVPSPTKRQRLFVAADASGSARDAPQEYYTAATTSANSRPLPLVCFDFKQVPHQRDVIEQLRSALTRSVKDFFYTNWEETWRQNNAALQAGDESRPLPVGEAATAPLAVAEAGETSDISHEAAIALLAFSE